MKKIILLLLYFSLMQCLWSSLDASATVVSASDSGDYPCIISDTSTIHDVLITSTESISNAKLFCGCYTTDNKLIGLKMKDISLSIGSNRFSFDELTTTDADFVKYILWDDKLSPYSNSLVKPLNATYFVTFIDWDGTVIEVQTVKEGLSAAPPVLPVRSGYIFSSWKGNFENVRENVTVTANYVLETADNIFKLSSSEGQAGEIITMTLVLDGTVKICGFDMSLTFDRSVLELVDYDDQRNLDIVSTYVPDDGKIKFNYSSSKNRISKATIMELTFRVKDTSKKYTNVSLTPVEIIYAGDDHLHTPADANYTLVNGMVFIE